MIESIAVPAASPASVRGTLSSLLSIAGAPHGGSDLNNELADVRETLWHTPSVNKLEITAMSSDNGLRLDDI
jgi:hypothetical protein